MAKESQLEIQIMTQHIYPTHKCAPTKAKQQKGLQDWGICWPREYRIQGFGSSPSRSAAQLKITNIAGHIDTWTITILG